MASTPTPRRNNKENRMGFRLIWVGFSFGSFGCARWKKTAVASPSPCRIFARLHDCTLVAISRRRRDSLVRKTMFRLVVIIIMVNGSLLVTFEFFIQPLLCIESESMVSSIGRRPVAMVCSFADSPPLASNNKSAPGFSSFFDSPGWTPTRRTMRCRARFLWISHPTSPSRLSLKKMEQPFAGFAGLCALVLRVNPPQEPVRQCHTTVYGFRCYQHLFRRGKKNDSNNHNNNGATTIEQPFAVSAGFCAFVSIDDVFWPAPT